MWPPTYVATNLKYLRAFFVRLDDAGWGGWEGPKKLVRPFRVNTTDLMSPVELKEAGTIEQFDLPTLKKMYHAGNPTQPAWLLTALFTGGTQMELAVLQRAEFDLEKSLLTHFRNKRRWRACSGSRRNSCAKFDRATREDVYQDVVTYLWRYLIPRYNRNKGTKFSTFAAYCTGFAITRAIEVLMRDHRRNHQPLDYVVAIAPDSIVDRAVEATADAIHANPERFFTPQQAKVLTALFAAGPGDEAASWAKDIGFSRAHSASAQVSLAMKKVKKMDPQFDAPTLAIFPANIIPQPEPFPRYRPTPEQLREMYEHHAMSAKTIGERCGLL